VLTIEKAGVIHKLRPREALGRFTASKAR
jgi:hypothetical protein